MKFFVLWLLPYFTFSVFCFGQASTSDRYAFSAKISALKSRSITHEKQIAELLSQTDLEPTNFDLPRKRSAPVDKIDAIAPPVPPAPYLPVPEYYEVKPPIPKEQTGDEGQISEGRLAPQESDGEKDVDDAKGLELSNRGDEIKSGQSVVQSGEDNAGDTITLARHEGYYFGPLLGFAFPDDGAVRDINLGKIPYESDSGYVLGLKFGKDFGTIKWEADYSLLGFDASSTAAGQNYEISSHGLSTRLILEKEIGELFDIRTGLGMGVGFTSIEGGGDYSGESFIYDFGLGIGYRIRENMSISIDYKYFLSAAEDAYDRIKSHMFIASANLDL